MIRAAVLIAMTVTFLSDAVTSDAMAQSLVTQRPDTFVDAAALAPGLLTEMRYATAHNFVGVPIAGYDKPICYLTRPAATALAQVVKDLEPKGLTIKVYDCYRPVRAVEHFIRWARDLRDQKMKAEFYPHVDKRTLFRDGYIASRSGHSRGSTSDLTLARRADGQVLDMGTPFDNFSPQSWPSDRTVSPEAQQNRSLLAQAMARRGFRPYDKEWWHFTLRHEPYPQTYFDFAIR
jgi:D-alanyl-D-alanine dipeptidase